MEAGDGVVRQWEHRYARLFQQRAASVEFEPEALEAGLSPLFGEVVRPLREHVHVKERLRFVWVARLFDIGQFAAGEMHIPRGASKESSFLPGAPDRFARVGVIQERGRPDNLHLVGGVVRQRYQRHALFAEQRSVARQGKVDESRSLLSPPVRQIIGVGRGDAQPRSLLG